MSIPWSAISSVTPFTFDLNLTSKLITSHFFAALSSFLANSLFWWSMFVKCYTGLSLGHEEAEPWLPVLSGDRITDVQGPTTRRLWKRWHNLLPIMIRICSFIKWLVDWRESSEVYTLCSYSQLITTVAEVWTVLLKDGCHVTKCGNWNSRILELRKRGPGITRECHWGHIIELLTQCVESEVSWRGRTW